MLPQGRAAKLVLAVRAHRRGARQQRAAIQQGSGPGRKGGGRALGDICQTKFLLRSRSRLGSRRAS